MHGTDDKLDEELAADDSDDEPNELDTELSESEVADDDDNEEEFTDV